MAISNRQWWLSRLSNTESAVPRPRRWLSFGRFSIPVPGSRIPRVILGLLLVLGGLAGFLPILGFWMIPLGFLVLSIDLPIVRRGRRKVQVWFGRRNKPKSNPIR